MTRALLLIVLLTLSLPASAAPQITAQSADQTITFTKKGDAYEPDELISTDEPIHIKLDRLPVKIETRAIYQGAVGEDGPWTDVPGIRQETDWLALPVKQEFDVMVGQKTKRTVTWPEKFDCAASGVAKQPDECARWTDIYKKCKQGDENGPCYTYLSTFELRVVYEQDAPPEITRINFPGGC
jgi:hypothetical protein